MYIRLVALIAFVVLACLVLYSPALPRSPLPDFTGHYVYRSLPYDFELDVEQKGLSLRGVFRIKLLFHRLTTYHFTGRIRPNGIITARHYEGSSFVGVLANDNSRINAIIRHRNGEIFRVAFTRPKRGWGGNHSNVGVER